MATPLDMIEAHLTWMRAGTFADTTINSADKVLRRLHRELAAGLHGALAEELSAWLASNPDWSEQTVSTYYKHIVRFYRWAVAGRHPWLSYDPSAELRRPVAHAGLPRPAGHGIVEAAVLELRPLKWRLVCRLVALAGLRPFEVSRLTRADVTREVITIKGKGGKTKAIPTHPLIWDMVKDMGPGPIITGPRGYPATAEYVSRSGAYYLRRAGLDTTLYTFRHYFGTRVQEEFGDVRVTQELMGHASLNTTANYTLVTSKRMRDAIGTLTFSDAGTEDAPPLAPQPRVAAPRSPTRSVAAGRRAGGYGPVRRSVQRSRP